jgi:D-3-phosphoglycerate dehydrogenase
VKVLAIDDPMIDVAQLSTRLPDEVAIDTVPPGDEAALVDAAADAAAIVVNVNTPVTADVFAAADDLQIVARAGVGLDNIDIEAATAHDVVVTNVPEYCQDEVATHTMALWLACVRRLGELDRSVKAGDWDWGGAGPLHRLSDQTVGLLSYGPIAKRVAGMLDPFGVTRIASDPYVDAAAMEGDGVTSVTQDTLFDRADHLFVLAPLTEETRGMVDAAVFERLPSHAVVVNTGRGPVVDEAALASALDSKTIGAAGIDVFETEPPAGSPLLNRDNVLCSPHAGWYSVEARSELNEAVATNLEAAFAGNPAPNRVDPEMDWV